MDNTSMQKASFHEEGKMWIWDLRHRQMFWEADRLIRDNKYDKPAVVDYAACGGEVLTEIHRKYPSVYCYGLDLVSSSVDTLKAQEIDGKTHDLENPVTLDRKFDIALAGEVIEHLVSPDNFLYSINHNLNDGGYLILSFPNSMHIISILTQLFLDLPPWTGARYRSFHIREYTLRLTRRLLAAHGFKVIRRYGNEIPYMPAFTRMFTRVFPRWGRSIILVAKKVAPPNEEMIKNTDAISDTIKLLKFLKQNKQWK
jgi:SAM-dependent methyltransferase